MQIWGINPNGDFVGFYRDKPSGPLFIHGFLQLGDGSAPLPIDYVDPDTKVEANQTRAFAINPTGVIVGLFVNSNEESTASLPYRSRVTEPHTAGSLLSAVARS